MECVPVSAWLFFSIRAQPLALGFTLPPRAREHQFKLRLLHAQGTRWPIKTEITESPAHETPASSEGRPYHNEKPELYLPAEKEAITSILTETPA
ncbi:hypothetical protein QQF64_012589 [Cirrhinus molitorella]|uniref:Uncharacterized protein n=1 Tax=Cirrhinus molitorella TaxID=172907 RepID=A0ABR3LW02_9TELE